LWLARGTKVLLELQRVLLGRYVIVAAKCGAVASMDGLYVQRDVAVGRVPKNDPREHCQVKRINTSVAYRAICTLHDGSEKRRFVGRTSQHIGSIANFRRPSKKAICEPRDRRGGSDVEALKQRMGRDIRDTKFRQSVGTCRRVEQASEWRIGLVPLGSKMNLLYKRELHRQVAIGGEGNATITRGDEVQGACHPTFKWYVGRDLGSWRHVR